MTRLDAEQNVAEEFRLSTQAITELFLSSLDRIRIILRFEDVFQILLFVKIHRDLNSVIYVVRLYVVVGMIIM